MSKDVPPHEKTQPEIRNKKNVAASDQPVYCL